MKFSNYFGKENNPLREKEYHIDFIKSMYNLAFDLDDIALYFTKIATSKRALRQNKIGKIF